MGYVRLPLGGDVWQDINPFRWIFRSIGQISLFSINVGRSSDPEAEEAILDVASYGRQLGRIGEALLAVLEQTDTAGYTNEQKTAIEDFKTLMREISAAKTRAAEKKRAQGAPLPSSYLPAA
jgi:hypothetical protein